jgi:endoglucanase
MLPQTKNSNTNNEGAAMVTEPCRTSLIFASCLRLVKTFSLVLVLGVLSFLKIEDVSAETRFRGVTLDGFATGADLDQLSAWNVNLVYYFVDPNATGVATNEAGYLASLERELTVLDDRLNQYAARGIKVAINLYGAPGEFVTRKAPAQHRVFSEQWAQTALVRSWQRITQRYKGHPAVWGYNLLNEPAQASVAPGLLNWRDLSVRVVDAIRQIDGNVRIILQPPYGNPNRLNSLEVLRDRGPIVYSFNAYTPYNYTHQGLYGIKNGIKYPTRSNNAKKLKSALNKGFRFGRQNNVPLFVAEFTAVRWAPKASKYLADMARLLEQNGVDWTYHSFYGSKPDAGDGRGRFSYPWSLTHTNNLNDRNESGKETDRLKALKRFFKKNRK